MDIIALISLVPDIGWLWKYLMNLFLAEDEGDGSVSDTANLARASRASRAGTRAARIIKIVRLIRLLRIVKIYKTTQMAILHRQMEETKKKKNIEKELKVDKRQSKFKADCSHSLNKLISND